MILLIFAAVIQQWSAVFDHLEEDLLGEGCFCGWRLRRGDAHRRCLRKTRSVGSGKDARIVEEYEINTALIECLNSVEKRAAIETGQEQETTAEGALPARRPGMGLTGDLKTALTS